MKYAEVKPFLEHLDRLMAQKEYVSVIQAADRAIAAFSGPGDGADHGYSFSCLKEFLFFMLKYHIAEERRQIVWSAGGEAHILMLKAYALFELRRHEEAVQALRLAIAYNPVNVQFRLEIAENLFCLNRLEDAEKELRELLHFLIYPEEIAKFYRRIGFLFVEKKKYVTALACYKWSLLFEESDLAVRELFYIAAAGLQIDTQEQMLERIREIPLKSILHMLASDDLMISMEDERRAYLFGFATDARERESIALYTRLGLLSHD